MNNKHKSVLTAVIFSTVLMFAARTLVDLTRDTTGLLPGSSGGTGVNSSATYPASGTIMITTTGVACGQMPALSGDVTSSAGACATAIANNAITGPELAAGSYIKGVFHTFCTGTAVVGATTNFDFAGFGSTATICSTALTTAAGGTKMTSAGTIKNLFVNLGTAGKSGDKITMLKNGSTTGAPTCTYGASTTCNDVATSLTVAQGDVITISNLTSASETAANIAVSFEFWN